MKPKSLLHSLILGLLFLLISVSNGSLFAQARIVMGSGGVYMKLSGGTSALPIYLVSDNPATTAFSYCNGACGTPAPVFPATGATSWIISEGDYNYIQWNAGATNASYVFPFGYSTSVPAPVAYIPFTFNKTVGTASVSVATFHSASNNAPIPAGIVEGTRGTFAGDVIDRWWRINAAGATADMTFSYPAVENTLAATNTDAIQPQRWNGTYWDAPVGTGSAAVTSGVGTVNSGSINQFSPWVLSRGSKPLPVEWLSVSSECVGMNVVIRWSTASEENADFFTVERSSDGATFDPIKNVRASGNSSTVKNYSAVDPDPLSGITYYRIRETDFNGESFLSKQITSNGCSSDISISVYPNPALPSSGLNVGVVGAKGEEVLIVVTDMLGREFYSKVTVIEDNQQTIAIDPTDQLAAGVYTIIATSNDNIQKKKLVVQ